MARRDQLNNIIAVVPARGGSKGVPRKNLLRIGDKSLVGLTVEAGLNSGRLSEIVVSTDDVEIQKEAISVGARCPFLRPAELSGDLAMTFPVVMHALEEMESELQVKFDAVMLLQPTTPFREAEDIDNCISMLEASDADSLVSVVNVGANHPLRMKRIVDGLLVNYIDQGYEDMRPRQLLPPVYIRNGAIYLTRRHTLERGSLVGDRCLAYEMPTSRSLNIDTPDDVALAQLRANSSF